MLKLILWITWLAILLSLCRATSKKFLLTPQFGFVACFIPQAVYAIFYVDKWDLDMSLTTLEVLMLSTGLFVAVCMILQMLCKKKINKCDAILKHSHVKVQKISVGLWNLCLILLLQLVVLFFLIRYINTMPGANIVEKIAYRNNTSKFVENGLTEAGLALPRPLLYARQFCLASGYIFSYLLIHSIVYKYKQHRVVLSANIIVTLICALILGDRFEAMNIVISALIQVYVLYYKSGRLSHRKLPVRTYIVIAAVALVVITTFQAVGDVLGRQSTVSYADYIATYLSGQLKNLDIFVRNGRFGCGISEWQTLYNVVNTFGRLLNLPDIIHFYDQPFNYINGYSTGNVYTQFYVFLHDGGFKALIFFVTLMAVISYAIYQRMLSTHKNGTIDMSVIIYSYVYFTIIFSFFSSRFYGQIFSNNFIRLLIFWYVLRWFITKVKLR